jgi:predicted DNA binding CopG/RHH family protein
LAPDIGGKARKYMKKKIRYTDEPIGKVKIISDFLPSPEELVLKDETVKITIALSKASVEFFKNEAKKYNTQYQKMIRRFLDEYAALHP